MLLFVEGIGHPGENLCGQHFAFFYFECPSVESVGYLSHLEMENVQQVTNLSVTMHPYQD